MNWNTINPKAQSPTLGAKQRPARHNQEMEKFTRQSGFTLVLAAILGLCWFLPSPGLAQLDNGQATPAPPPEADSLYILDEEPAPLVSSVCQVIGELPTRNVVGRITELQGEVYVERLGRSLARRNGDAIMDDDFLYTDEDSYVMVRFNDGALMSLAADSRIHLYAYWYELSPVVETDDDCAALELFAGTLRMISGDIAERNPGRLEILAHAGGSIHRIRARTAGGVDMEISLDGIGQQVLTRVFMGDLVLETPFGQFETGTASGLNYAVIGADGQVSRQSNEP